MRRRSFIRSRVDDAELQAELVPHLVAPLDLQAGGQTTRTLRARWRSSSSCDDQPRLDGLAQADVVGDEQVHAGHLERAHDRVELVVLDLDAAPERRLEVLLVGRGDRAPANGVEEGIEPARLVEALRLGKRLLADDAGARLELPDDPQLLAEPVVLDGEELDEVLRWVREAVARAAAACSRARPERCIGAGGPGRAGLDSGRSSASRRAAA